MGFRKAHTRRDGTFVNATTTNTFSRSSSSRSSNWVSIIILLVAVAIVAIGGYYLLRPDVDSSVKTLAVGDSLYFKSNSAVSDLDLFQKVDHLAEKKRYLSQLKKWERTKYEKEGGKTFDPLMLDAYEIKRDEFYKHSTSFVGTFQGYDTVHSKRDGDLFIRIKRNPKLHMGQPISHYSTEGRIVEKGIYVSQEEVTAIRQDSLYR